MLLLQRSEEKNMLKKMFVDIIEKLFFRKTHIFPLVLCKFYMSLYFQCLIYFLLFEVKKVKNKNEEDERLVKYPNLAFRFVDATTKIS